MTASLSLDALPLDVFIVFAVFCRVGALFMTAPALGDFTLSPRMRLAAALAVTAALAPVMAPAYPGWANAGDLGAMATIIFGEILAGGFLGLAARVMMSALNVAGQIIAFQMGLSLAQIFDPTQELQGAIVGGFSGDPRHNNDICNGLASSFAGGAKGFLFTLIARRASAVWRPVATDD